MSCSATETPPGSALTLSPGSRYEERCFQLDKSQTFLLKSRTVQISRGPNSGVHPFRKATVGTGPCLRSLPAPLLCPWMLKESEFLLQNVLPWSSLAIAIP